MYKVCGVGERSFHPKLYLSICHCTEIILWWKGIDGEKPVVLKRDTALRNLTGHVTFKGKWKGSTRFKCGIFKYALKMNVRTYSFQGNWLCWWFCIWQIVRISELEGFFVVMMNFHKAGNKLCIAITSHFLLWPGKATRARMRQTGNMHHVCHISVTWIRRVWLSLHYWIQVTYQDIVNKISMQEGG